MQSAFDCLPVIANEPGSCGANSGLAHGIQKFSLYPGSLAVAVRG